MEGRGEREAHDVGAHTAPAHNTCPHTHNQSILFRVMALAARLSHAWSGVCCYQISLGKAVV